MNFILDGRWGLITSDLFSVTPFNYKTSPLANPEKYLGLPNGHWTHWNRLSWNHRTGWVGWLISSIKLHGWIISLIKLVHSYIWSGKAKTYIQEHYQCFIRNTTKSMSNTLLYLSRMMCPIRYKKVLFSLPQFVKNSNLLPTGRKGFNHVNMDLGMNK